MANIEPSKGEIVMYQPDETIRLEVRVEDETVGLSGAPFFMPLRQHSTLFLTFVAYPPYRHNNSNKILAKSLDSAEIRLTFASSKDSFLFHIA